MIYVALILVLLILLNALYVAAEFAAVSVRRSRIQILAEEGNRLAGFLHPVVRDPVQLDRYIAACQIGITLSSLILGAYGQSKLAPILHPLFESIGFDDALAAESASAAVVLVALTALQMVLGELVPKSVAIRYPARTALYTVVPLRWSVTFFSWFILVLNGSGMLILRLLGLKSTGGHRHIHSAEEIEMLFDESGDIEPDENVRFRRALRLGLRPTRQLMVHRRNIEALEIGTPLEHVISVAADSPYTRIPVYRKSFDDVVGILHTKDLVRHYALYGAQGTLEQLLRPVLHVPETATADHLLQDLRRQRTHQAIVVDEFGGVEGLVTLEDLLTDMLGEVTDEFKKGEPQPEILDDGRIRFPGMMRLYETEPWLGRTLEGESDTIGGFMSEVLGHLPEEGEVIDIEGVQFLVEQVDEHQVVSIVATPRQHEEPEG
ncbi:MAG: hemolysin family protein [Acidobacteria bacterium]|nr:hemolysin family protein [Acidobacteriota bacterium]